MRRIVGAVLIGLGALLGVVAVGLPLYVAPAVTKLPYDLVPCDPDSAKAVDGCLKPSVVEAKNASYLQIAGGLRISHGDLTATTEVIPQIAATAAEQEAGRLRDAVIWDVYQTVLDSKREVISKSSTELALDRKSAEAITDWPGQWIDESGTPDRTIKYTDLTYKFPFGTKQRDYRIFDTDLRSAPEAKYIGVEQINGVEVYHFRQVIEDVAITIDPTSLNLLLATFAPGVTSGEVYYRNTREVWVDPVTGSFIKVREQQHKELRPTSGPTTVLLDADFVYTDETIENSAATARTNGRLLKLVTLYAPIGLGILTLLLIAGGVALARGRRGSDDYDDSLEPRHRVRGAETHDGLLTDTLPRN